MWQFDWFSKIQSHIISRHVLNYEGCIHSCTNNSNILAILPNAVPGVKVIGTLISLLLTIPPAITTVADITWDDSVPLNVDDWNVIIATVQ